MTKHEVLVAARNYLDREGWCQFPGDGFARPGRPQCALGAIEVVGGEIIGGSTPLYRVLDVTSMVDWNDEAGRTKAEVLAAFDAAIAATAPAPADPFPSELPDLTPVS